MIISNVKIQKLGPKSDFKRHRQEATPEFESAA